MWVVRGIIETMGGSKTPSASLAWGIGRDPMIPFSDARRARVFLKNEDSRRAALRRRLHGLPFTVSELVAA